MNIGDFTLYHKRETRVRITDGMIVLAIDKKDVSIVIVSLRRRCDICDSNIIFNF